MTFEEHVKALLGDLAFKLCSAASLNDALKAETETLKGELVATKTAASKRPLKDAEGRGNR